LHEEGPVKNVEITVFSHATEDEEKVKCAVINILSDNELNFHKEVLTGHYEDPILLFSIKVENRSKANDLLSNIYLKLSTLDKTQLMSELSDRVDESGSLYMRLDKQKAYLGNVILNDNDPIRIKFRMKLQYKTNPAEFIRSYIESLDKGSGFRI